jgi:hypothetical protein
MATEVSVYLNIDRVYVTAIELTPKGFVLNYINSTDKPIDLENLMSPVSKSAINQLGEILFQVKQFDIDGINCILPAESVHVTQFPAAKNQKKGDIHKILEVELQMIYPHFNPKDFEVRVFDLIPDKGKQMKFASIITNDILSSCNSIFEKFDLSLKHLEISQIAAHSAFLYNYPELSKKNVVLASLQDNFMDISVLNGNKLMYYNLLSIPSKNAIGEILEKEFTNILENTLDSIASAFYFGSGLTKEINMMCWETSMMMGFESKRLNPFKLMRTSLDQRTRDYCSRVFHLYPSAIGGIMKSVHSYISLK